MNSFCQLFCCFGSEFIVPSCFPLHSPVKVVLRFEDDLLVGMGSRQSRIMHCPQSKASHRSGENDFILSDQCPPSCQVRCVGSSLPQWAVLFPPVSSWPPIPSVILSSVYFRLSVSDCWLPAGVSTPVSLSPTTLRSRPNRAPSD